MLPGQVVPAAFDQYINDSALDRRPPDDTLLKLVWERLCIHLAWEVADRKLAVAANRILQLSKMVVSGTPSVSTLRFLRHVSRCFIWGFDAECVILCRGAIDRAFAETVSDAVCDKHGLEKAKFGHTLTNRIKAALREGMIDEATNNAAFRVNTPATKATHRNPDEVIDVLGIVRDTRDVVQHVVAAGSH